MTTDETLYDTGFLRPAPASPGADRLFADDRSTFGYVIDLSQAWAHLPDVHDDLLGLLGRTADAALSGARNSYRRPKW